MFNNNTYIKRSASPAALLSARNNRNCDSFIDRIIEGGEAHRLLQAHFRELYPKPIGETEAVVFNYSRSKSGIGRADIVLNNGFVKEVYEIKPITYYTDKGADNVGIKQLEAYIAAYNSTGSPAIKGSTYNPGGRVLTDEKSGKRYLYIVIDTDEKQQGMIYYTKIGQDKPKLDPVKEPVADPVYGVAPKKDYSEEAKLAGEVVGVAGGLYIGYQIIKALVAIGGAPETGGASLSLFAIP